jgi:hypothetical protein
MSRTVSVIFALEASYHCVSDVCYLIVHDVCTLQSIIVVNACLSDAVVIV